MLGKILFKSISNTNTKYFLEMYFKYIVKYIFSNVFQIQNTKYVFEKYFKYKIHFIIIQTFDRYIILVTLVYSSSRLLAYIGIPYIY